MKKLMMLVAAVAASVALADGAGTPTAKIKSITNRYPWNGKIDVEYELSNLESTLGPLDTALILFTKFVSGVVEITKTNDLSDAELAARTVRRTFDCRELFGENKWDAEAQSAAKLEKFAYAVIDVSGGANTNSYPVTYYMSAPAGDWNTDEYKTSKIVLYYVKEGKYLGNQKTEQTTTGFWIGLFPITEAQYAKVMGPGNSTTKPQANVSYTTLRGTDNPNATVADNSFLKLLCDRTGLDGFDLPTESQWEIACRAGSDKTYYWGDIKGEADKYMWYFDDNSSSSAQGVGQKLPNAWGLYDMAGNVWEWCRDGYHSPLTVDSSADVCLDLEAGYYLGSRVRRGGAYNRTADFGASSSRDSNGVDNFNFDMGFRLSRMSSK